MTYAKLLLILLILSNSELLVAATSNSAKSQQDIDASIKRGMHLYLEGKRDNGQPLTATGAGESKLSGTQSGCINCHRRSGLGGVEGNEVIPPISGNALFSAEKPVTVQIDKRFNRGVSVASKIYDTHSLSEAIRLGKHSSGRVLTQLMPRYKVSDAEVLDIQAYLRTLSANWAPGVDEKEIALATVITPEVDANARKIFLDTINTLVNQHNLNVKSGQRQRIAPIERRLNSRRYWKLNVWELTGNSDTWEAQLIKKQSETPVFTLVSGLSKTDWQPVQHFCKSNKVPCWFPSVDHVISKNANDEYGVFFSEGLQLEAKVMAKEILATKEKTKSVLQIIGEQAIAKSAAQTLADLITKQGIQVINLNVAPENSQITNALRALGDNDIVVNWLDITEKDTLIKNQTAPPGASFWSATLLGEKADVTLGDWAKNAVLIDRLELPKIRAANLAHFKDWLTFWRVPLVDEKMQSEIYFAVNSFAWMTSSMLNNYYTDYLMDRAEATLSMRDAMQVQEEVQAMMMGGGGRKPKLANTEQIAKTDSNVTAIHSVDSNVLAKRESISAYPRMSLGNNQQFASKGAYVRKFNSKENSFDEVNANWVIP
ncbi:MAG: hypothetical protein NTY69_01315 [Methylococcales bacterium]|nr:hypothetical protein [Methylococcales bacterium]